MPPRILTAIDYGFRKVFRVVLDDSGPEWVHPDGSPHTDATGRGPAKPDGTPGDLVLGLAPGTECHDCRYGWDVRECVFTGDELVVRWQGGKKKQWRSRAKTNDELLAEVRVLLAPAAPPKAIAALEGATL